MYVKKPVLFLGLYSSLELTMAILFREFQLDLKLMKKSRETMCLQKNDSPDPRQSYNRDIPCAVMESTKIDMLMFIQFP